LQAQAELNLAGRGDGLADATESRQRQLVVGEPGEGLQARNAEVRAVEDVERLDPQLDVPGGPEPRPREALLRLRRILRWIFEDAFRSAGPNRETVEQDIFEMVMSGRFFAKPRMMWPTVFSDDEWRAFAVPALFLVGENEKIYSPRKVIRRLQRVALLVRTEIIPGAGHDLTLVKADLVAERILAFLDESPEHAQPGLAHEPEGVSSAAGPSPDGRDLDRDFRRQRVSIVVSKVHRQSQCRRQLIAEATGENARRSPSSSPRPNRYWAGTLAT